MDSIFEKRSIIFYLPLVLIMLFFLFQSLNFPIHDFANYYFAGYFLKYGIFEKEIYDAAIFNLKLFDIGFANFFVNYTPNTPFSAILFYPFSFLNINSAKILFNCLSIAIFFLSIVRTISYWNIPAKFLPLLPVLFFVPIKNNILFGQQYLILAALILEAFIAWEKSENIKGAILLSLAVYLKVFPVLLVIYLLLKKKYRALLFFVISCTSLFFLSLVFIGFDVWWYYVFKILPKANQGEIIVAFVSNYQSAFMLFRYLFQQNELFNPSPFFESHFLFWVMFALFKGVILAYAIKVTCNPSGNFYSFSTWVLTAMLISPYGNTSSLVLLLFPLGALLLQETDKRIVIICCVLIFCIANVPVHYFAELPVLLKFPRLILLVVFLFLFLQPKRIPLNYFVPVFMFFLASGFSLLTKPKEVGSYVLNVHRHALIIDYFFKGNKLVYKYWSPEGPQQFESSIPIVASSCEDVCLFENQIHHNGIQLTFSTDQKKKPCLINEGEIIYLSDQGNGPGFYTLRKITIADTTNLLKENASI